MKSRNFMWRYSIVCLLVMAGGSRSWAQNVVFTAEASSPKMGIKDQIQLKFTITNAQDLRDISPLKSTDDYTVVSGPFPANSVNISSNGYQTVRSESHSVSYVIQPKHTGTFTITPLLAVDGQKHNYKSNPLNIEVVEGSLARQQQQRRSNIFDEDNDPFAAIIQRQQQLMQQQMQRMQQMQQQQMQQQQGQQPGAHPQQQNNGRDAVVNDPEISKDLFIRVTVDKNKVHVGEQITTSYKLYSRIPMQIGISKLPTLNGFWTQDFDIPRTPKPQEEILDGKKYQVFLLKKSALFPQQTGTLELDPAEAQGVARIVQQAGQRGFGGTLMMNDPFFNNSFFSRMMYRDVKVHLRSSPVKVNVLPLPETGKPEGYGGAVGNFAVTSKADKSEITTDEVANYTITINGSGNLKLMEAPKLTLPNGLATYDPVIVDTITGRSTTITGSKIITYAITPRTPGEYTIPGTSFAYYDAQTGKYVALTTQPATLHVKPGKHYNPNIADKNISITDIHDISTQPIATLSVNTRPLLFSGGYWSMYAFPLLAFIGLVTWRRRDEELSRDVARLRHKRANKVALKRLTTANKLLQQNAQKPFYDEVSKAIWLYLSDKLNIPLSALSRDTAHEALHGKIPDELGGKLESVIFECETALYAQTGGTLQMQQTYSNAVQVISELEDRFKA